MKHPLFRAVAQGSMGLLALVAAVEMSRGRAGALLWRELAAAFFLLCVSGGQRALVAALPVLLSYEPVGFGFFLGPFMYVPLFIILDEGNRRDAVNGAVAMTLVQTVILSAWVMPDLPAPAATEWLLAGLIFPMWLAVTLLMQRQLRASRPLARWAACLFIPGMEWLRTQTPGLRLPSLLTAHAVAQNFWLAQLAEPFGVLGLSVFGSAMSLLVASAFEPALRHGIRPNRPDLLYLAGGLLFGAGTFAAIRVWSLQEADSLHVSVRVVQSYESPTLSAEEVRRRFARAVQNAIASRDAEIIVLPENALNESSESRAIPERPDTAEIQNALLKAQSKTVVLAGVTSGAENRYKVSAWAVQTGREPAKRDKLILAPIGECAPFAGWPWADRVGKWITGNPVEFVADNTNATIPLGSSLQANLCFCFEYLIPGIWAHRSSATPADMQVCVADLSYFGYDAIERVQHRQARRLRAIELRTPFLFVANGGSELHDRLGRLVELVPPEIETALWTVSLPSERPAFPLALALARARYGPFILGLVLILAVLLRGSPCPRED